MSILTHYCKQHAAIQELLPGQNLSWLTQSRKTALDAFTRHGFPNTRNEQWKYTDVRPIEKHPFKLVPKPNPIDTQVLDRYLYRNMACHLLVFVDGRYLASHCQVDALPPGVIVKDLASAFEEDPAWIKDHLSQIANPDQNGFAAMNLAFMNDGALIKIADNTVVELPIHLLFITSSPPDTKDLITAQPRILVMGGDHSKAKIIESYHALTNSVYFNNITTEIKLGANTYLEHYKLQQESTKAFHIATLQVDQGPGSHFTSYSISLGGRLVRNDINIHLGAKEAHCNLYGLYTGHGRQHTDYHTRIDHAKPNGSSMEIYKGILNGHSRAVFNGQVTIHPHAQKSSAQQTNKNLLLSENAEIDTKPQLEIYADDVSAAHGATVGDLDKEMLFYLCSRGLDYPMAHALLVYGFAHEIIEKITLNPIQQYLQSTLMSHINPPQKKDSNLYQ